MNSGDFPSDPVVKAPCPHCRGHRFEPWLGNQDLVCHAVWPKKLFKKMNSVSVPVKTHYDGINCICIPVHQLGGDCFVLLLDQTCPGIWAQFWLPHIKRDTDKTGLSLEMMLGWWKEWQRWELEGRLEDGALTVCKHLRIKWRTE